MSSNKDTATGLYDPGARLRVIESLAGLEVVMLDAAGRVATWNAGAQIMKGYPDEEALGQHLSLFYLAADRAEAKPERDLRIAAATGRFEDEGWRARKDGTSYWAHVVITALHGPSHDLVGFAEVTRDLSLLRDARETVKRLNEQGVADARLRGLLEAAPDAMVIVGRDGCIELVNGQTELLFGYNRDELIGQPVEILVPERYRAAHPGRRNGYFEDPKARPMGAGLELHALRKDGTEFPAEISLSPMQTPEGTLVTAAIRDISDRKIAEQRFRGLLESAPDAMVIVGRNGRMVLINAQMEKLFGYRREELLGQPIEMLVPERYRQKHPGYRTGYLAAPTVRAMGGSASALFGVRKDGSEFAAEISLSPIETPEGTLATAAIRDITERKRLEELEIRRKSLALEEDNRRMQEANRLKSEFLANMSHELRTPLNAIIGFAELMFRGKVGPLADNHKEYLGDILTSSKHLLQLINDVLDLAKVESGKMEFRPEPLDLAQVIAEVRDILRGLAATKRIRLETSVDPACTKVTLDPSKLKQVLYNYLSNALKFTPEDGRVVVRAVPEGTLHVRIEVEDTGIGIRPQDTHRLFIEFQQLDAGTAKKYAGTGLGLALTKRIVEAQGGQVGVRSEVERGSTFWALLPVIATGPVPGGPRLSPLARWSGHGG